MRRPIAGHTPLPRSEASAGEASFPPCAATAWLSWPVTTSEHGGNLVHPYADVLHTASRVAASVHRSPGVLPPVVVERSRSDDEPTRDVGSLRGATQFEPSSNSSGP